jgi:anthranilate synthase component 2/putative glutamine amidotransferase
MRPLIGITTYREPAQWGTWHVPAVLLPASYADAVAEVGGEPVLLPTGAVSADVVARLDGLVLTGGADIEPGRYGQAPGPHTTVLRPDRDTTEVAVLQAATCTACWGRKRQWTATTTRRWAGSLRTSR